MKVVGVLGGSFNPIHKAHLAMAEAAHEQFSIPEILIMPTAATYYKDGSVLVDPEIRMDMIRLAIEERGASGFMKPSYLDLDRGGVTYTYDTINELKLIYDKIFFIIGTDSLMYIDKWVKADLFLPECTLLVCKRFGATLDEIYLQRDYLVKNFGAHISFLKCDMLRISSSEIRQRVKDGGSISGLVPGSVEEYIKANGLYL